MAARLIPVALAVICGVSTGVATFDGELKAQRRRKVEEEYRQEVATTSAPNHHELFPEAANTSSDPPAQQMLSNATPASYRSWSSFFGLSAWRRDHPSEDTPRSVSVKQESPHTSRG